MNSATLDCVPDPLPLDRAHVLMNKFPEPNDLDYKKVVDTIQELLTGIQTGTLIEQADTWLHEEYYDKQKLKIERLSGQLLDMDQCYINLALVERQQAGVSKNISKVATPRSSPFSLTEQLKVETPHESLRVELSKLFQPRDLSNGTRMKPRRILIQGRAGVGKTTLCKKIVHDFVHKDLWRDLFKRLVWVQLRDLKDLPNNYRDLGGVLEHIFFQQHENKKSLCDEMKRHIQDPKAPGTVFLLDGLDEITEIMMEHLHRKPHPVYVILKELWEKSSVIITTRPHTAFPRNFKTPDLELDTIGFSSDQVQRYIETLMPYDNDAIQAYLLKNRIMQSLVHIPIYLDALCYIWPASSMRNGSSKPLPETMTAVYEAMITELWKKDNERLEKDGFPRIGNTCTSETEPIEPTEYDNLGYLAFSGLYSNVVEFQPSYRRALYERMDKGGTKFVFDEIFARLSFLRTSDPSKDTDSQGFHFIHLTFQEYFSAKHFVKAWKVTQRLQYTELHDGKTKRREDSCHEFFQKHKYAARYNIMWRFVAGLLDAEGWSQITSFFEAVESEPVDLLGPTHQRLVMHCLAEVVQSDDIRTKLEEQLSQWLQFECKFRGISRFVSETELPERALNLALERASDEDKMKILTSLRQRRSLPLKTIEMVTLWLEGQTASQKLRFATLGMFLGPSKCLPSRTLNAVKKCMDDDDPKMRQAAERAFYSQKEALQDQPTLPEKDIQNLVSRLEDKDGTIRWSAVLRLRGQSKLPEETIQAMMAQFGNQDDSTRAAVFEVLRDRPRLPSDGLEQMAAWLEGRGDESDDDSGPHNVRRGVVGGRGLGGHQGQLSDDILLAVARRLKKQDRNIRQKAMRVLQRELRQKPLRAYSDDVFQVIVSWLGDQDKAIRQMALEVLAYKSNWPEGVLRAVAAQLEEPDRELLRMVCRVLQHQSVVSPDVWQVMVKWLGGQDRGIRKMALEVIGVSHILPEGVLKAVLALLEVQDGAIRVAALSVFTRRCHQQDFPDDILRAMGAQLDNGDKAVRKETLKALKNLGRRQTLPDDVLSAVVAQLNGQDEDIQEAALGILEKLGSHQSISDRIVQAIAAKLKEQNNEIRSTALRALQELGYRQAFPENVLGAVKARLEDRDPHCRSSALEALLHQPALPGNILQAMVVKRLKDDDAWVRCTPLGILKERRILPEHILKEVAARLSDKEAAVRRSASETLASQTALSEDILSAVLALLGDGDRPVQNAAMGVLFSQTKLPGKVPEAMLACATNPNSDVRSNVMKILRKQSGLSESFLTAVAPWMEDNDIEVRMEAVKLLGTNRNLPDEILQEVTTRLQDTIFGSSWTVLEALAGQRTLPDTIVTSPDLYPIWVATCFEESLCCYIEDGISYLDLPAGLGKVPLEGQSDELREAIRERQRELDMPKWAGRKHEQ